MPDYIPTRRSTPFPLNITITDASEICDACGTILADGECGLCADALCPDCDQPNVCHPACLSGGGL